MALENAVRALTCPTSVASGAAVYVGDLDINRSALSIAGTFTATFQLEASIDGTNFFSVGAAVAGTGATKAIVNPATDGTASVKAAQFYRVRCSAYTSGSATAVAAGAPNKLV